MAGEGPSGAGNAPDRKNHPNATSRFGGCSGTVAEGHRVVQLPCGHPVHARCVLSNLENGGGRLLLQCRAPGCGAERPRRDTLAAAVQADPGLRRRAEKLAGGLTDEPTAAPTLFNWSQDSPGIGPALDDVSMDDLTLRFHTVKKIQPWLASQHARLQTHVVQLVVK